MVRGQIVSHNWSRDCEIGQTGRGGLLGQALLPLRPTPHFMPPGLSLDLSDDPAQMVAGKPVASGLEYDGVWTISSAGRLPVSMPAATAANCSGVG